MCPQPTLWRHEKVVFVELLKVFEVCLILALGPKDLERPRWEDFLGSSDLIGSYSLGGIWAPPDDAPKFSLVAESVLEASFLKTPKSLSDQNPVYWVCTGGSTMLYRYRLMERIGNPQPGRKISCSPYNKGRLFGKTQHVLHHLFVKKRRLEDDHVTTQELLETVSKDARCSDAKANRSIWNLCNYCKYCLCIFSKKKNNM